MKGTASATASTENTWDCSWKEYTSNPMDRQNRIFSPAEGAENTPANRPRSRAAFSASVRGSAG